MSADRIDDVTLEYTIEKSTKSMSHPSNVDEPEAKFLKNLWLAIAVDACFHPKILTAAMELGIDDVHAFGIVTRMWLMTFKFAKDGDLWRGDEEMTHKFIAIVTGYKGDIKRLVEVLQKVKLLNGWLIHDWLDYTGSFFIRSYKTSRRDWLVETWEKHGRDYGARYRQRAGIDCHDDEGISAQNKDGFRKSATVQNVEAAPRNNSGTKQEVSGTKKALQYNPTPRSTGLREIDPKTLSPPALKNKPKRKTLKKGGLGESAAATENPNPAPSAKTTENRGYFHFLKQGGRAESLNTPEFPPYLVTAEDVYLPYQRTLRTFGILSVRQLRERIAHCKALPSAWMTLFQDKIHAVLREREDGPLIEQGHADPVAMTIAALLPKRGNPKHIGTEASAGLFWEVMLDFGQMLQGQPSIWQNRLSGPAIAVELERRKGKRNRRRKAQ